MELSNTTDFAREASYQTPFVNSVLFTSLIISLSKQKHTPDTQTDFNSEYDYIVVGAGSAGSVVAGRMAEGGYVKVLLLEAGNPPPRVTEIPAISAFFEGTDLDWKCPTEPQKYCAFATENRRVPCPFGKAIGGSSCINGMFYIRGNREDYNAWETEDRATGWGWEDVFPYFLTAENNTDPDIARNGFHSVCGPLNVGRYPYHPEYEQSLRDAARFLGYRVRDINGAKQTGFADLQGNVRDGQRCSTAKAYLVPNENRENLDILSEAYVTKILIENKVARGVRFDFKNGSHEVRASREVILCAGALKSPQILMLSGIGDRKILEQHNIPLVIDLPVGKNYHDHVGGIVNFIGNEELPTYFSELQDDKNIMQYIDNRTGPLAAPAGVFGMSFLADDKREQLLDLPLYQLYFFQGITGDQPYWGLRQEVYDQIYGPYKNRSVFWCISQNLRPLSRGTVSIRSKNPYDCPVIDPNYFKDPKDLEAVVAGMKKCYDILLSPPFKKFGIKPFDTLFPGCENMTGDVGKYSECCARANPIPVSHSAGSVRMGDPRDSRTVVDTKLRVKGIKGLRVVDASVIPTLPRANTNNPVIMIAEKASDLIKKDIKCESVAEA